MPRRFSPRRVPRVVVPPRPSTAMVYPRPGCDLIDLTLQPSDELRKAVREAVWAEWRRQQKERRDGS
jgi:hypothetical protein